MHDRKDVPSSLDGTGETIIAQGIQIQGDLRGTSDVRLEGTLQGNIMVEGTVFIGEAGRVIGDISAGSIIVEGDVHGNIESAGKVHLGAAAKLKGNISSRGLSVQDGAWFEGRISDAKAETEPLREPMVQYQEALVHQ